MKEGEAIIVMYSTTIGGIEPGSGSMLEIPFSLLNDSDELKVSLLRS